MVHGVEADGEIRLSPAVDLFAGFSWIRGENRTADEPFSRIPPVLGRAGVRWRSAEGRLRVEYFSRVAGRQDRLSSRDEDDVRIPAGGSPGWQTQNLRGAWRVSDSTSLLLALENLTDERYRLHGSGIDAPGFNAVGTLEYRF